MMKNPTDKLRRSLVELSGQSFMKNQKVAHFLISGNVAKPDEPYDRIINEWTAKYPLDRWWRNKFSIPINSNQHREVNVIDIKLEYQEDMLYKKAISRSLREEERNLYRRGTGNWLKKREAIKQTQEEIDDMFDQIDVDKIIEGEDGSILL